MAHILACPRYPIAKLRATDAHRDDRERAFIPLKYLEALEQNQKIATCCRHAEDHDIEAWYSCEADAERGIPDIYILYCNGCGRRHRRFCLGGSRGSAANPVVEHRPFWEVH